MGKQENQKLKLLILKEYLEQNTDEEHYASTQQLLDHLHALGIPAERKAIYGDMDLLEAHGCDILRGKGRQGGYAMGAGTFDLPELKLLADAVLSSKFLTEKKSNELLKKLGTLTSRHHAQELRRSMVVSGRVKSMNESVIYNVDLIHQAINADSQIRFRYFEWNRKKEKVYRSEERVASPLALCWDNDNYYLVAHTQKHGLTNFRVDKMDCICQTGEARVQNQDTQSLDLASYGKQVFGMFNGERKTVKLRFENGLAGVALDRFGRDVMLIPDGENHFTCTAEVLLSPLFYGWVASFGSRVKILWPQEVREEFRRSLTEILEAYASD